MKSYPVVLSFCLAACGSDNGKLFDDEIAAPPASTLPSDQQPDDDRLNDELAPSDPLPDEATPPASVDSDPPASTDEGGPDENQLPLDNTDSSSEGSDEDPEPPAPELPTIVSVSPDDGATGVARDEPIVLTFSTPMNQEETQAAYQSEGMPSSGVSFSWNEQSTVLTITPNEPLQYTSGADPEQVQARRLSFFVSASATDQEGRSMASAAEFSFSLFRQITGSFAAVQDRDLSGSFRSNDTYGNGQCAREDVNLCVGDSGTAQDEQYKGFITFDLSDLPPATARIDAAELVIGVTDRSGNPFGNLGNLIIEQADFETIGSAAFSADAMSLVGVVARNTNQGEVLRIDVRDAVEADRASRTRTQFRLRFADRSDFDGNFDAIVSSWDTQALDFVYLIP